MSHTRRRASDLNAAYFDIHVLDGAGVLPEVDAASLLAAARLLARDGRLVVVDFDEDSRRLVFYEQSEWLPAGRRVAGMVDSPAVQER